MEKIIHVIVDTQENAYQALQVLRQLDANGDISLAESVLLTKDAQGNTIIQDSQGNPVDNTVSGALIGGLFGLLAGPLGFLLGTGIGALAGSTGDVIKGDHALSYLESAEKTLPNGKSLLIVHLYEDWEVPVDTSLKPLGAEIQRLNFDEQADQAIENDLQEIDNDISALEASLEQATDETKDGIRKDIDALKEKRNAAAKKFKDKLAYQQQQYQSWSGKQKGKLETWKAELKEKRDLAKQEKLEKEIAHHEQKIAELKSKL